MLELRGVNSSYGEFQVVKDISLTIEQGHFFLIVGPNGHGKSSLLKTICGLLRPSSGRIIFRGREITRLPMEKIVEQGLVYVAEDRHLFPEMTVIQNLQLGAYNSRARAGEKENLNYVFDLFPQLKDFKDRRASTLSGGESRMLTLGRGIMSSAELLAIDEPSLGLAPLVRNEVFNKINEIRSNGITILLVEQNVHRVIDHADRVGLLEDGRIVFDGSRQEALVDDHLKAVILGE